MPDIFIELDRDLDFAEDDEPRRSPRFGKRWRPWVAAALATVIVSTLGNAEFRPYSGIELVAQFEADSTARLLTIDGALLVLEPDVLTSYDLETAETRWRLPTGFREAQMVRKGDMLLLTGSDGEQPINGPSESMKSAAVEIETGHLRWRLPGYIQVHEHVLIGHHYAGESEGQVRVGLTIYSADGQRRLWETPPGIAGPAVHDERDIVGALDRDTGVLTEYDLFTGAVVKRYTLPELIDANGLFYHEGVAIFYFDDGRHARFDGLTLQNRIAPDEFFRPRPIDCGDVWCESMVDGPGYILVDKETGQKILTGRDWELILRTDAGLIGVRHQQSDGPMPMSGIFDPKTRQERELEGWSVVSFDFYENVPVLKGPVYLYSYKKKLDYFGVLKPDGVRTIGVLPHAGELRHCVIQAPLVACLVNSNLVRIWRLT